MPTPYLAAAQALADDPQVETHLPTLAGDLPALTPALLEILTCRAGTASLTHPRFGWAIAATADAAARCTPHLPLQAQAAWHLARAANDWFRPQRVEEAALRAKALFEALGSPGWAAACDWQRYANPWTRSNYTDAVETLLAALETLQTHGLAHWAPHCQISLAYALILRGHLEKAAPQIEAAEAHFRAHNDPFNLAQTLLKKASLFRRQGKHEDAFAIIQKARQTFRQQAAPACEAQAEHQIGLGLLNQGASLHLAARHFSQNLQTFEALDLPLWVALCKNALAQIHNRTGQFPEAARLLAENRATYAGYQINGLEADCLTDCGALETLRGNYLEALAYYQQAEARYQAAGAEISAAVATIYQGQTYGYLNRYQQALHHLERAQALPILAQYPERQAEGLLNQAMLWARLNDFQAAHTLLDQAETCYTQTKKGVFLAILALRKAEIHLQEGKAPEAAASLTRALAFAEAENSEVYIAHARYLLGETWLAAGEPEKALPSLQTALTTFTTLQMEVEAAHCQNALGSAWLALGEPKNASAAWQAAFEIGQGLIPAIVWRASLGLAEIHEAAGRLPKALASYQQAVEALHQQRNLFWQPALAGRFWQGPATTLDRAVHLTLQLGAPALAAQFIESSKAQTLLHHLSAAARRKTSARHPELQTLETEIRWLYKKIDQDPAHNSLFLDPARLTWIQQLREKNQAYDTLLSRLERAHTPSAPSAPQKSFGLPAFRQAATCRLGQPWAALDYYQAGTRLTALLLTPTELHLWEHDLTPRQLMALEDCHRLQLDPTLLDSKLLTPLSALLPPMLHPLLTPDLCLILSPHGDLHPVPWAAIPGPGGAPLVERCIPVVTPSLWVLQTLWDRAPRPQTGSLAGFVLAVSEFEGRRPPLPLALAEAEQLAARLGASYHGLAGAHVTLEAFQRTLAQTPLHQFAFLHIASHAFADERTGRLSGFALSDQDLWLDHLWEFAPLPPLVTFSACNGAQNLVYTGDEHVGLSVTALAAGAHTVVSNLWPIHDQHAAGWAAQFYAHTLGGAAPAQAVAAAQRAACRAGEPLWHWGGYLALGTP